MYILRSLITVYNTGWFIEITRNYYVVTKAPSYRKPL